MDVNHIAKEAYLQKSPKIWKKAYNIRTSKNLIYPQKEPLKKNLFLLEVKWPTYHICGHSASIGENTTDFNLM